MIRRRRLPGALLLRADAGASTAEFAIVFPMFFLLLFGIFEFSRASFAANALQFAVAQSARYAMTSPSSSSKPTGANCASWTASSYEASLKTYMQTQLNKWFLSSATPTATASVACGGSPPTMTVTVKANYTFSFWLTNSVFTGGLPMSQSATVTTPLS